MIAIISPATAFVDKISNIPASRARTLSLNLNQLLHILQNTSHKNALDNLKYVCSRLEDPIHTMPYLEYIECYGASDDYGMHSSQTPQTKRAFMINPNTPYATLLHPFSDASELPSVCFLTEIAQYTKNQEMINIFMNDFGTWDNEEDLISRSEYAQIRQALMQNPNCPDYIKFLIGLEG